jgi:aminoglycoside/choline kinase family phosphotransferase
VSTAAAATLDPRLGSYLAERYPGRGPSVQPLSGDASTRRYFRVRDGELSVVLALYPEPFDAETSSFRVVRELLAGFELPVPAVLDHDGDRGIFLLEDLGDLTLQQALEDKDQRRRTALYSEAIEQLVRLQRAAALGPRQAACFEIAFDIEKLTWELHYFLKHFVEGLRGARLSTEDRSTIAGAFHRLCEEIASWPRVLCHRDYHSRNLMLHAGRLFWVDFQDARMGPASYDLASLLRDSYVELPEGLVADQAEGFRQRACPGESRQLFLRRFELASLQRNLKALGTFGYQAALRGNPVYMPYVPRTLAHARRNLLRHPELEPLHRALARHLEEL